MKDVNQWPLWLKLIIGVAVWVAILWTPKSLLRGGYIYIGLLAFLALAWRIEVYTHPLPETTADSRC